MKEAKLKVQLLEHTPNPELVAASAARLCYSPVGISDIIERLEEGDYAKLLEKIMELGHYSVLEHVSFSFGIEGISRACSHQLVRHRLASFSQQSQRYVTENGELEVVIPPSILNNPVLKAKFIEHTEATMVLYKEMIAADIPAEDARFILPNAAQTKLVLTMNARELLHFFSVRCCNRAQWEIREMAKEMLKLVKPVAPIIFGQAGPACLAGSCPEGKMTCGLISEVREEFRQL